MLNGSWLGLLRGRILPAAFTAACVLAACHGKVRRFPDDPEEVEASNRPDIPGRSTSVSGPNSMSSSDRSEGQQAPGGLDGAKLPGAQDACSGDGDSGSCPPSSLCSPDAGAVCEATCPGCLIEGECVAIDQLDPDTICRFCDPDRNPRGWSANDGVPCDDGLFCTVGDVCSAGACDGSSRECEDGVACNGVSTCDEATRSCSPDVNGCGNNALCNIQTDSCVSTCAGCVIGGVCLAVGIEASGNPCLVCDPTRSTTTYTAVAGKSCGAGPAVCSQQDTCDGQGRCLPNHLLANTPCGSPVSSACDQPDTCDGNGNCLQRGVGNGTGCDDGEFCTVGDQCQGGQCVPTGNRNCGAGRICNEAADQCQCQGCQVGNACVAFGGINPSNPCQVCDPSRNNTAYSINAGAQCGSGATECSGQDTCNAQGQCGVNHRPDGTACSSSPGGSCLAGSCVLARQELGTPCSVGAQCLSGFCRRWFADLDQDLHGNPNSSELLCSPDPANDTIESQASNVRVPILIANGQRFSGIGDDCCDAIQSAAGSVFPGNTNLFTIGQTVCGNTPEQQFDYNCDGRITDQTQGSTTTTNCSGLCNETLWVGQPPPCGQFGLAQQCILTSGVCGLSAPDDQLRACQ